LVDAETGHRSASGAFVVDAGSVEDCVLRALRTRHRNTVVVPFDSDVGATAVALRRLAPAMVFNLTEWFEGNRGLDHAIAGVLEMLGLPYTGTGPGGLQLCRDKMLSKQIVARLEIKVPRDFALDLPHSRAVPTSFPLLVKPRFGDGSDAIGNASLVRTPMELNRRLRMVRKRNGAAVCEEFIPGRDLYVGLLGTPPRVLSPFELVIESRRAGAPQFATYHLKNNRSYAKKWCVRYRRAILDKALRKEIDAASYKIFCALGLRDYARLDFRLTADGQLFFIEANPNPDLSPHTYGRNACLAGQDYTGLILDIVAAAQRRSNKARKRTVPRGDLRSIGNDQR
ncbi:MAG TPA: hypothetical protein VHZ30_01980, partial [Verrucomicrobiae bacterium]|nr:hypothetical protein [Verrucomicrobiae bacterium]